MLSTLAVFANCGINFSSSNKSRTGVVQNKTTCASCAMCESKYTNVFQWENIPGRTNPKTPLDVRNTSKFKSHPEGYPVFLFDDQRRASAV